MVKPHVLLVSSLILNTSMAVGCASGFMEPASTPPAEMYQYLSDEAVLYRQEAGTFGQPPDTMKGKLNGLPGRRARTRSGRNAIETLPNKLRCRPWRPIGMPKNYQQQLL